MCLTALDHTRLPQPGLSAQISSRTSSRFLLRCCELLRLGLGMPAMFNSDVLVLGMVNRGKTLEDARASSLNGCVACFCDGKDRMASSGYFNLAKCLELALNDGRDRLTGERLGPSTGDPRVVRARSTRSCARSARRWRTSWTRRCATTTSCAAPTRRTARCRSRPR